MFGYCVQGKMMSCGVALERLQINETDMLLTSTELKDKDSDIHQPNTRQQNCEINEPLDLQATCTDLDKDVRKPRKKHGQQMRPNVCSMDCTDDGDSNMPSAATLRLTLKKVKVETGDKQEDTCLYVCHTKKPNTSKKLLVKCADRSSNTIKKIADKDKKDKDGFTSSGKVIY